jgi:hypothetical protein
LGLKNIFFQKPAGGAGLKAETQKPENHKNTEWIAESMGGR